MLRVTYLYDTVGWALHNLGLALRDELAPYGVAITCVASDEWHRHPGETDLLYVSYTGLVQPFPYRNWAAIVACTVHDPCELSHFENRADWKRLPLQAISFEEFDRVSVISAELREILVRQYGIQPYRTPTWPLHGAALLARAAPLPHDAPLRAMSSTNIPEFFSPYRVLRRFRHPGPYLRDHRGRFSLRQTAGLTVLRRRKNIRMLKTIRDRLASNTAIECDFRFGATAPRSREAYETDLVNSDLYVCTSTMEGGPLPVLEAVFAGLAVLSTPVGQVSEWVHHGENGWICNTPDEFVFALEAYARDPGLMLRHRERSVAIARVARFPTHAWLDFLLGPDAHRTP